MNTDSFTWYEQLAKPWFAPPAWVFGPAWLILYVLIIISFTTIIYKVFAGQYRTILLWPLFTNVLSNILFTPLQFTFRSNILAAIDIAIVLGSIISLTYMLRSAKSWLWYMQLPYIVWVAFATILQFAILYLNW